VNPYVLLGGVVGLLFAVVSGFFSGERVQRNADVVVEQRAAAAAQASFAAALEAAEDQRITAEHALEEAQAKAQANYLSLRGERDAALKQALAASHTPAGGLYVPAACPAATGPGAVPEAAPDPAGPATALTEIELPDAFSGAILSLAAECDDIADKLGLAVETLKNDRQGE